MEDSVKIPWGPSTAPALRALKAIDARYQLTRADTHLRARMEDVAAKKMLLLSVIVLVVGQDVTVTSQESLVKQWLASRESKQMSCVIMVVTVSTLAIHTFVNALLTIPGAIVKIKWTNVKTTLVTMVPPAGHMLVVTSVIVCQAILDRTVR